MYRIYSTGIETAAASAILIPILFLYQIFIFHNIKKTAAYILFSLYLAAICFLVGFPNIAGMRIVLSHNFIPLRGMLTDNEQLSECFAFYPIRYICSMLMARIQKYDENSGLGPDDITGY